REEPSGAACEGLHHGRADCVLLALPFACGAVSAQVLFEARLFVAGQPGEMGNIAHAMPSAEIDETRLLLLEDGHCLKD
ncbi:hydrogen peroxide-inducible genes activator, partial [Acinetobacter baumannii]